jgi:hypothetical protein
MPFRVVIKGPLAKPNVRKATKKQEDDFFDAHHDKITNKLATLMLKDKIKEAKGRKDKSTNLLKSTGNK